MDHNELMNAQWEVSEASSWAEINRRNVESASSVLEGAAKQGLAYTPEAQKLARELLEQSLTALIKIRLK
jgi:hypothetical protein